MLALASQVHRESTVQDMADDPRYRQLVAAGVRVSTLGRQIQGGPIPDESFTASDIEIAARAVRDADLILSLKEQPLGILLALRARGLMPDIPVAACLHRSDPPHSGPALGRLAEATATGLVTATISCAKTTDEAYARAGVSAARRFVIANGIDTDVYRPGTPVERHATRNRLAIPVHAPAILFAARFDAMKDPGLFLRALARHRSRQPGAHYLLCGAGMTWENEAFRALAEDSGVRPADDVHALGIRRDMPSIYQVADIIALTSAFGEASPLCLIEGAACGATPVTTDVGDAAAQVDGFGVITPADEGAIAAAWQGILERRRWHRRRTLDSRPRLGRERMLAAYTEVSHALLRREEAAA
ncbi:glycosyltransferase [Microbacterium sp. CFBP9034]|uniref:glycosyltransferase n=1 Tax=Microbacterium sp. CFBP9034 TaxID=3096540 RepID=UPI002A6B7874|nr:glycosyltransferase [Microbacterium sp. CFBP9034]MDY0908516.1 glycosyltransferase [Microbacterium sp. CFBP9034]